MIESRDPDPVEALALYEGQRVLTLTGRHVVGGPGRHGDDDLERWELAMDPESMTGLLAWLEAAPPGLPSSPF